MLQYNFFFFLFLLETVRMGKFIGGFNAFTHHWICAHAICVNVKRITCQPAIEMECVDCVYVVPWWSLQLEKGKKHPIPSNIGFMWKQEKFLSFCCCCLLALLPNAYNREPRLISLHKLAYMRVQGRESKKTPWNTIKFI